MAEACLIFLLFVVHFDHHHSSDLTRCVKKQPLFSQKNLVSSWHCYETIELNIFECVCVCYTCGACMYVPMRVCTQRSGKTLDIHLYHYSSLYFKTDPQQEWSKGGKSQQPSVSTPWSTGITVMHACDHTQISLLTGELGIWINVFMLMQPESHILKPSLQLKMQRFFFSL